MEKKTDIEIELESLLLSAVFDEPNVHTVKALLEKGVKIPEGTIELYLKYYSDIVNQETLDLLRAHDNSTTAKSSSPTVAPKTKAETKIFAVCTPPSSVLTSPSRDLRDAVKKSRENGSTLVNQR